MVITFIVTSTPTPMLGLEGASIVARSSSASTPASASLYVFRRLVYGGSFFFFGSSNGICEDLSIVVFWRIGSNPVGEFLFHFF